MYSMASKICVNADKLYPWSTMDMQDPPEDSVFEEDKSKQEWLGVWVNTWQYSLLKEDEAAQIEVLKGTIEALNESVRSVLGDTSATWFKFATQLKNSVGDLALAGAKVGMASMGLNPLA